MNLRRAVTPFLRCLIRHNGHWTPTFGSCCKFEPYGFSNIIKNEEEIVRDYLRRIREHMYCCRKSPDPSFEYAMGKVCPSIVRVFREEGVGGSGFIIDSKGTVLTSACNIFPLDATSKINASLPDGSNFSGTILEANMHHGLALLKIQSKMPLPITMIGSLENYKGNKLISIEHPLKRGAYPRPSSQNEVDEEGNLMPSYEEFISKFEYENFYLDSSGGPIVNLDGEVVGISTRIHIIRAPDEKCCYGTIKAMAIEEAFSKVGYVESGWRWMRGPFPTPMTSPISDDANRARRTSYRRSVASEAKSRRWRTPLPRPTISGQTPHHLLQLLLRRRHFLSSVATGGVAVDGRRRRS